MPTERLYHREPTPLSFSADVVAHGQHAGRPSVILARTAFYPEAGGQMADRGALGGAAIVDVQVDDADVVHHLIDGPLPEIGVVVEGQVDRPRRRLFMALHTAQHMLSQALIEAAGAETVSARLGESVCTVDLGVPALDESALARAAERVNQLIEDDLPVRAFFPTPDELARLPLRRRPKVSENIRVVEVEGFDVSPCGGTHVSRTAQLGLLRIEGLERYKGQIRVSFDAGRRAREAGEAESRALRALAQSFSAAPLEAQLAVDKLRRELDGARDRQRRLGLALAEREAERWTAETPEGRPVVAVWATGDRESLRAAASALELRGRDAILAAPEPDGLAIIVSRGRGSSLDAGATLRALAQAAGGKGGGRPERAEGKLPLEADLVAAAGRVLGTA